MSDQDLLDLLSNYYYWQDQVLRRVRAAMNWDLMGQEDMVWHELFGWINDKEQRAKAWAKLEPWYADALAIAERGFA